MEPRTSTDPLQLLIVEDENLNRLLLRASIARAPDARLRSAELLEAETLSAAREMLVQKRVDLIILDVRLPDGSGLQLARELSAVPGTNRPKIVVLSASVLDADRSLANQAGIDAFLGKPYRPADLLTLLADLVTEIP